MGLEKYEKGIRYLDEDPDLSDAPEGTKKDMDAIRSTLNSNAALLANKLKDFKEAVKFADAALAIEETGGAERAKALYRRALAEKALKDEDSALKDLEEAAKLAPGDGAVVKELAEVRKSLKEKMDKEKAAMKKFFS